MEPFVQRMVDELSELQERLRKLNDFTKTDKFQELPAHERCLLLTQRDAMSIYERALNERLSLHLNA